MNSRQRRPVCLLDCDYASSSDGPPVGAQHVAPLRRHGVEPGSLGAIVRSFKSALTKRLCEAHLLEAPVWQRNYYERVIRNETELNGIRSDIDLNPIQWRFDRENPGRETDSGYDASWSWLETAFV